MLNLKIIHNSYVYKGLVRNIVTNMDWEKWQVKLSISYSYLYYKQLPMETMNDKF